MPATFSRTAAVAAAAAALLTAGAAGATVIATFDDLPSPPALDGSTGLQFANSNSLSYLGITWDGNFSVVGDQYRVDTSTPGPLFGQPHSPHYFVTNGSNGADGLLITTDLVLTGVWVGPNEYYGYGHGADEITIVALAGATELASVSHALSAVEQGQPDPLEFMDTSAFLGLSGITGYRIDRDAPSQYATNWVADDFQFEAANAPLPATPALTGLGLLALGIGRRARKAAAD